MYNGAVKLSIPTPRWWQRAVMRLAATRAGSWLLSRILAHSDRLILRLSGGQRTLTTLITGLPVIRLTTMGAVSGQLRVCPLIPVPDGERLIVFATNFGSRRHPSWYHNLSVHPQVSVALYGASGDFIASRAEGEERERYWRQAVAMYAGYGAYEKRAGGREIPVVVLTPVGDIERGDEGTNL